MDTPPSETSIQHLRELIIEAPEDDRTEKKAGNE
jgi:hypothetical protein